jgi:iron complex transport system substrate-binding protein
MLALLAAAVAGCGRPMAAPDRGPSANGRVVSLAPSLTEIVCAVGGGPLLAGRTDVCNYPPGIVAAVPVLGGFGRPSLEAILAQRATLVIESDLEDKGILNALETLGVRHVRVPCRRLDDVPVAIRTVGDLLGRTEQARAAAGEIEAGIAALRRAAANRPGPRPRVFVERWGDPLMTVGRGSFVAELVSLAGGANVGDDLAADYAAVTPEWVLTRDPEAICCLYAGRATAAGIARRPGWEQVAAVRSRRIYDDADLDVVCRPGPRVLDGVAWFRRCVTNALPTAGAPAGERGSQP